MIFKNISQISHKRFALKIKMLIYNELQGHNKINLQFPKRLM
jgi:hypothetical protein